MSFLVTLRWAFYWKISVNGHVVISLSKQTSQNLTFAGSYRFLTENLNFSRELLIPYLQALEDDFFIQTAWWHCFFQANHKRQKWFEQIGF